MSDDQNNDLERRLSGRTLQVYLYLQKKKEGSGIREVQRDLGLSSPSVAEYQVEKLVEMGLASRDSYGRVFVTRKVKVKALESYVNFGRFTVPRLAFYASIFTAIATLYVIFNFNSLSVYGVAVPAGAAAVFWFEAWKLWKYSLFEKTKKPERDYFWASLVPGLAALAVFIAGTFFLFYYVEPSGLVSTAPPPANPNALPFQPDPSSQPIVDDLPAPQRNTGGDNNDLSWLGFSPLQMTILLFAGALVAGFMVYLMVKYRCDGGVLAPEQEWN
jgi:hypothetical protein